MGFKFAAGIAVIAVAAASAAAIIAIHNAPGNTSPAGSRMSVGAYQRLIAHDFVDPNTSWSSPCGAAVYTGCLADANRSIPVLQSWLKDLDKSSPPSRFAIVDSELRQHLSQSLTALRAMTSDIRAGNEDAVKRDYVVAVYGAEWVQVVVPAIWESQQVTAATYVELVLSNTTTLDHCGAACGFTATSQNCVTSSGLNCDQYFGQAAVSFASFQADLLRKSAPASLAAVDSALESDLDKADGVLLTLNLAVGANDQQGINAGFAQLARLVGQIDQDAAKVIQG